jgi:hypothetical protein
MALPHTFNPVYTVSGGSPPPPPTTTEYVAFPLTRLVGNDDAGCTLRFETNGSILIQPYGNQYYDIGTSPDPLIGATGGYSFARWLHNSTTGSDYQARYTFSGNLYADDLSWGASTWLPIQASTEIFMGSNWLGSPKVASGTYTITIKTYAGTPGTGSTVWVGVIDMVFLTSGGGVVN